jgi:L-amino acid N-acyltransferase
LFVRRLAGAWPGYRFTVEHPVHVRSDRRGTGMGRKLIEEVFPYALALDRHVMIGAIDASNAASIKFHERLDFREVAIFGKSVCCRQNESQAGGWRVDPFSC